MTNELAEREPLHKLPEPGERRRLRLVFGATIEELARSMRVTRKTASSWERGISEPAGSNRAEYAALLSAWAITERDRTR